MSDRQKKLITILIIQKSKQLLYLASGIKRSVETAVRKVRAIDIYHKEHNVVVYLYKKYVL